MKYLCINSVLLILSCTTQVDLSEQSKLEILETEAAFSQMANELGVAEAFVAFADDSAVLNRKNVLIMGIDSIRAHYSSATRQGTSLEWAPDFVDASKSGDLGYTYGKYIFTKRDSAGKEQKLTGTFHTVWKRQEDGSWRYVWD